MKRSGGVQALCCLTDLIRERDLAALSQAMAALAQSEAAIAAIARDRQAALALAAGSADPVLVGAAYRYADLCLQRRHAALAERNRLFVGVQGLRAKAARSVGQAAALAAIGAQQSGDRARRAAKAVEAAGMQRRG